MKEIIVYLLIATSGGPNNFGTATTLATFKDYEKCMAFQKALVTELLIWTV